MKNLEPVNKDGEVWLMRYGKFLGLKPVADCLHQALTPPIHPVGARDIAGFYQDTSRALEIRWQRCCTTSGIPYIKSENFALLDEVKQHRQISKLLK